MPTASSTKRHAVILGASMAGLLAARALSDHFDQITLLERDPVQERPESRKGQPQTRHLHGLLATGLETMTHYFPDLPDALIEHGAIVQDMGETMVWHTWGGYRKPFHAGIRSALMSRPLLEYLIRERVLALPNVTLLDRCDVEGLHTIPDRTRVVGVAATQRDGDGNFLMLDADLVVDCSGRGSRMPKWLAELGYAAPAESEVTVNVGYATRVYRRDPADSRSKSWFLVTPDAPRSTRFGGMFPIEGDRWIVSIGGWERDHAPLDEPGYAAYAAALPLPDISEIVSTAEPLSEIMPHKFKSSLRRHYEKLTRFPEGLLVLGDALSSFNPTYGQGMTSAAMQAAALDELLADRHGELAGIAPVFFKRAAKIIDVPWQLAVGEDFRFPSTTGPKPAGVDIINAYVTRVHRATQQDTVVGAAFLDVMNLAAPPPSLFKPNIVWRVWRANRRRRPAASALTPAFEG